MATTFITPTSLELSTIGQKLLPTLRKDNPIFAHFPERNRNNHVVAWEQWDNFRGMMQPRGLNGKPPLVNPLDSTWFSMTPGTYGEYMTLSEREMTAKRQEGTISDVVDVNSEVLIRSNKLTHRQVKRESYILWQLVTNGYFVSTDALGTILHADSYDQRTFSAVIPWSTVATAVPLSDLRQLWTYEPGYSITFQAGEGFANNVTVLNLLGNQNANDLKGLRVEGGGTYNSLERTNEIFVGNGLPPIRRWPGGWEDDNGVFQKDIADNQIQFFGSRTDGETIGAWANTRNSNNEPMGAPGTYYKVFTNPYDVPSTPQIHRGMNGGVELYFPSALVTYYV